MHASPICPVHREGAIDVVLETDETVAVCLEGEFDLTTARTLRDEVDRALERGGSVILDLSGATFIDSSVLHVLVLAAGKAREREQALVLQLETAAIVERVLEIAEMEQVLPRAHNREEALRLTKQHADAA